MPDDIVLRLDRATAEDLYVALYEAGEHIAAGAAITPPTAEEAERLGRLLRDLGHALGRRCSPYYDHFWLIASRACSAAKVVSAASRSADKVSCS